MLNIVRFLVAAAEAATPDLPVLVDLNDLMCPPAAQAIMRYRLDSAKKSCAAAVFCALTM